MHSRRSVLKAGIGLAAMSTALGGGTAAAATTGSDTWRGLRSRLQGDLVLPTDPDYERAKQLQYSEWDAARPRAIAYCETPADVQRCVRLARRRDLPVRLRSGGHAVLGWSTGDGLVIDVSRLNHATADGDTVHVGPGLEAIDAVTGLGAQGRQAVTGTCPTVGAAGFLTGGGIGLQTRRFGVGSDRMVSAQVVLADGRLVRTSATREPDLFWALRGGGGGNFGVVVDFELRPIEAPRSGFFATTWSWDHAVDVLGAWQAWTLGGSRDLGTQLLFVLPDGVPDAVPSVIVNGAHLGSAAELDAALAEFTALVGAQPTSSVAQPDLPYADAMRAVYGCADLTSAQCRRVGRTPEAVLPRTSFLREQYRYFDRPFTPAELHEVVTTWDADRRAGQFRALHCMSLGGRANEVGPTETAYVHRSAEFIVGLAAEVLQPSAELEAATVAFADDAARLLDPIGVGAYVNFPGGTLPDWRQAYYGENYPRLTRVKRQYDPENFFRHPRSIDPAPR